MSRKKPKIEEPGYSSDIDEIHRYGIMADRRTIFLEAEQMDEGGGDLGISHNAANRFLKNLAICQSTSADKLPITIIVNSIGGCVANGFAIYDAIKHCSCPVTIKVYGNCMSMGTIILQAATYRMLSSNAGIMYHHGDPGIAAGSNSFEVMNMAKFSHELGARADDIVLASINRKREKSGLSHMSRNKFQEENLKGKYMFAEEAVNLGLADYIISENHGLDICDHSISTL